MGLIINRQDKPANAGKIIFNGIFLFLAIKNPRGFRYDNPRGTIQ